MLRNLRKNQQGVTLIELLIVMIIVAILSVVIFVSMTSAIEDAGDSHKEMRANVHAALENWVSKRVVGNPSLAEGVTDGLSAAVVHVADFVLQMEAGDDGDDGGDETANKNPLVSASRPVARKLYELGIRDKLHGAADRNEDGKVTVEELKELRGDEILKLARSFVRPVAGIAEKIGLDTRKPVFDDDELRSAVSGFLKEDLGGFYRPSPSGDGVEEDDKQGDAQSD
jgi:prepilin-type N-terminal cleavage/methylation domain-containing protein